MAVVEEPERQVELDVYVADEEVQERVVNNRIVMTFRVEGLQLFEEGDIFRVEVLEVRVELLQNGEKQHFDCPPELLVVPLFFKMVFC